MVEEPNTSVRRKGELIAIRVSDGVNWTEATYTPKDAVEIADEIRRQIRLQLGLGEEKWEVADE